MIRKMTKKKMHAHAAKIKTVSSHPHPPVNVAIPNTVREKMQAILSVARAIETLSIAINGTNVRCEIKGNYIETPADSCGIKISTEPYFP